MRHAFFSEQLKRLVSAFGEKAINEEKSKLLWAKFKDVDDGVFVQVIDNIVLNQRQSPILDDFNREVMRARSSIQNMVRGNSPDMVCITCDGSGWLLTTPRGCVVPIAEKCDCKSFARKIDADENYDSAFSDDDRKAMVRTCIDRIKGGIPDAEWSEFQKAISLQIKNHESAKGAKLQ